MEIDTSAGPAQVELTMPPDGRAPAFLITLTHGAGGTPDTKDILAVAEAARDLGAATALVTQPYRVRGARAPGSAAKQDAAWTDLTAGLREQTASASGKDSVSGTDSRSGTDRVPLVQCGRSNGARVACRTAQATGAAGVIALAFPLHPPGKPEKSRAGEIAAAGVPVLIINGERDPFGIPEEDDGINVVVLPGETHALSRNPAAAGTAAAAWLRSLLA